MINLEVEPLDFVLLIRDSVEPRFQLFMVMSDGENGDKMVPIKQGKLLWKSVVRDLRALDEGDSK